MKTPPAPKKFVRASQLELSLASSGTLEVRAAGRVVVGSHGLRVLAEFGVPRTMQDVVAQLALAGTRDFVDLTSTILSLVEAGALLEESQQGMAGSSERWDAPPVHVRMLRDEARTRAFISAVERTVRPDDVVLDIGTGTGVLAMAAARAGAKRVYAIEASGIAPFAEQTFRRNGFGEQIQLFRGWSTQLQLPERATVLVSETVGNEPLGERIVDTFVDARARLLAPGARLLPSVVRVTCELIAMPTALATRNLFTAANLERFRAAYGFDFAAFARAQSHQPMSLVLHAKEFEDYAALTAPTTIATVDLASTALTFRTESELMVTAAGRADAALIGFEIDLAGEPFVSHPRRSAENHSWCYALWTLDARHVSPGESVRLAYDYAGGCALLTPCG